MLARATISFWRVLFCCALIGSFALVSSPAAHAQSPAPHVVISEVQTAGSSGQTTQEFIELYNPTNTSISLEGWRLAKRTASGTIDINLISSFPTSVSISAYSFFLIAHTNYTGLLPDLTYNSTSIADDNSLLLYRPDGSGGELLVDLVGWGSTGTSEGGARPANPTADRSIERKALATSSSGSMAVGGVDSLLGNGYDTDNNAADFVRHTGVGASSNPQKSNSDPERLPELTLTTSASTVSQTEPVQLTFALEGVVALADYSLTLSYDPTLFTFDVAQFHAALAPVASESVNASTPGQVVVTQQGGPLTGDGSLVTLHFLARTTADLGTFSLSSATFTNSAANPINGAITPSAVQVAVADRATLQGTVTVQGRTNHSGVAVYLYPGVNNHHTTTDSSGFWQFDTAWPTRPNYLLFRLDGYLDHLESGVLATEGGTKSIATFVLKGGDANRDRVINVLDVAFIGNRFGLAPVTSADAQADLNGDGNVNVLDLTMSASNYGVVTGAEAAILPEEVQLWLEAFYP